MGTSSFKLLSKIAVYLVKEDTGSLKFNDYNRNYKLKCNV